MIPKLVFRMTFMCKYFLNVLFVFMHYVFILFVLYAGGPLNDRTE